jgi:oligopeptide transport system permease protein
MARFVLQRLLTAIPTLLLLVVLSFLLIRVAPGGPFDTERSLPPEVEANLRQAYHLDEPVYAQFGRYLANLLRGDLGPSFQYRDFTVNELIAMGFPTSLRIGGTAMLLAIVCGLACGTLAALRQNRPTDYAVMAVAMTGISIPNFVVAPLLILGAAIHARWLPAGGLGEGQLRYLVLPVVALALPQIAYIARLTRASMIEVLRSNFVRTARAQGLAETTIILRHALKPALLPVLSYIGPATAAVITGSVVIEEIFGIPGIGRYFVTAALNRDYTLVMGVVVFYGVLILLANFLVDLLYGCFDPRIRH